MAKVHYMHEEGARCGRRPLASSSAYEDVTCKSCRRVLLNTQKTPSDEDWDAWVARQARRLYCPERPCGTCPYRRDTPPGIWAPEEYEKLRRFDADGAEGLGAGVFLCHQSNATGRETACRGWVGTHYASMAMRMAMMVGRVDPEDVPREPDPTLYASGNEAADAGLAGVENPSRAARGKMAKLIRRRAGR